MMKAQTISMTVRDACEQSGLSRAKVYQLIARGELKSVMVDGRRLIITQSLLDLLSRGTRETVTKR